MKTKILSFCLLFGCNCLPVGGQLIDRQWRSYVYDMPADWYGSEQAVQFADNVLLYQFAIGGFPKNTPIHKPLTPAEQEALASSRLSNEGATTDNGATTMEMDFLAKVYRSTKAEKYREAFVRALNYLLKAQYSNGGFPQFYPLREGYYSHITYNDDSMCRILRVLRDVSKSNNRFGINIDAATAQKAQRAFDRGIDCILKTQYIQNGVPTVWCAQHDEFTLQPAKARAYELPSLSGAESANVVLLLMEIENPAPEVVAAVRNAVAWFDKTRIKGIKVEFFTDDKGQRDRRVVSDASAPDCWARFYTLTDNRPFFCDRDGVMRFSLAEIGQERRGGYSWYGTSPAEIFKRLPAWEKQTANITRPLAFPSAEGFGKYTSGGRGGKVYTVTNLNDSGEGSLRYAIEQRGARTVVFTIDGTIALKSKLSISSDSITIAGQTAPGEGICIKNFPLMINANNVIIRYIRCRMGDEHSAIDDAATAMRVRDLIIDHCSFSWSIDECLSVYRNENTTVQWCMITHSLSKSKHSKGAHGFGGIWGGSRASFHHNLLAHHSSRNPRFGSDSHSPVDFRNNVVFNWGYKAAYGGGQNGRINFVANYYKYGPATAEKMRYHFLDPAEDGTSSYYLAENLMYGSAEVTADNWKGVSYAKPFVQASAPFEYMPIRQDAPEVAFEKVLRDAGCSHRRDSYDASVVQQVRTGTATEGETFDGGGKGIIDSQNAVGGWVALAKGKAPKDTDGDGIPDKWEKQHHLNPKNPADGAAYSLSTEYTNLEVYLNGQLSIINFQLW